MNNKGLLNFKGVFLRRLSIFCYSKSKTKLTNIFAIICLRKCGLGKTVEFM